MYVCVCVYIYVYICVSVCAYVYVCINISLWNDANPGLPDHW